jgi:hypothetical protein
MARVILRDKLSAINDSWMCSRILTFLDRGQVQSLAKPTHADQKRIPGLDLRNKRNNR